MKPKIIFIHGMFLNPKMWEKWISYFEARGFSCEAPAWPFHVGEPADLRSNVPWELGTLGLSTVRGFYQNHLRRQGGHPILIGHSLGGLIVQKLVAEGLAQAGVCIAPAAPNKMLAAKWSLPCNAADSPAGDGPCNLTAEEFQRFFANTLPEAESRRAFQAFSIPESRQVLRDVMGAEGTVDLDCPHVPLLFIGAEKDAIVPAALVRRNASAYTDQRSCHEYVEISGRSHLLCNESGWEEVAARTYQWLEMHMAAVGW